MGSDIWVVTEHRKGQIRRSTFEALGLARTLAAAVGGKAVAILPGHETGTAAEELGRYGADRIVSLDDPALDVYSTGGYTQVLAQLAKQESPRAILLVASAQARDLAPRLAARLDASFLADCVDVSFDAGALVAKRYAYSGKAVTRVRAKAATAVVTLRQKAFAMSSEQPGRTAEVVQATVAVDGEGCFGKVKEYVQSAAARLDVTEADVVVSGGRALKGPEGFPILEELAAVLGGAVGASRAAVDAGWCEHSLQVGQTGKVVAPKVYIACGISGAIQHLVGMVNSKTIVVINKDAEAPIFKVADYGVVGDLFQIVPALTAELKKVLEK
ncbi:MAG: electron transfer flavoprotein subunit alpha/FixB family protein [Candidatus Riflebacteria bacterium]|nr:electron transfer flavoprotein subunit alpha/FixB family protein [Candidatus Riflebacteria bacterium]